MIKFYKVKKLFKVSREIKLKFDDIEFYKTKDHEDKSDELIMIDGMNMKLLRETSESIKSEWFKRETAIWENYTNKNNFLSLFPR